MADGNKVLGPRFLKMHKRTQAQDRHQPAPIIQRVLSKSMETTAVFIHCPGDSAMEWYGMGGQAVAERKCMRSKSGNVWGKHRERSVFGNDQGLYSHSPITNHFSSLNMIFPQRQ